jgi:hypothetical protein
VGGADQSGNRRGDLDPRRRQIGVRIRRASGAWPKIQDVRARFYELEDVIRSPERIPSRDRQSAFGARSYQPHVTLLLPGSGIDPNLTTAGEIFRNKISHLTFDQFVVKCHGLRE